MFFLLSAPFFSLSLCSVATSFHTISRRAQTEGRSGAAQKHPIEAACTKARNWGEAQSAWEKGGAYRSYEKLYFMAKITENFENR